MVVEKHEVGGEQAGSSIGRRHHERNVADEFRERVPGEGRYSRGADGSFMNWHPASAYNPRRAR